MFILIVYLQLFAGGPTNITMQEFSSHQSCQVAGTKTWEFSGRKVLWTCVEK